MRRVNPVAPNGRWTLGLLTHGAGDPNSHNVWAGVVSFAEERDINLVCFPGKPLRSPVGFEAQSNILYDLVSSHAVDGLVVWASGLPLFVEAQAVRAFCERYRPLPMVTVGIPVEGLPGVQVDNYGGMRMVVEHLIDVHGRSRFAFIRGPDVHQEAMVRYQAFADVLRERGLPLRPELVFSGNFKESGGQYAIEKLIDQDHATFDALVAASDNMAIGAMKALQSRGIRVPDVDRGCRFERRATKRRRLPAAYDLPAPFLRTGAQGRRNGARPVRGRGGEARCRASHPVARATIVRLREPQGAGGRAPRARGAVHIAGGAKQP